MTDTILTTFAFLIIFTLVEFFARKYKAHANLTRKVAHILSGILTFFTAFFLTKFEIISISVFFILLLLVTKSLNLIKSIHDVERRTFGEIFFPLGNILCALLFLPHNITAFQFGVLIMALSDAFAALVGTPFGKHQIFIWKNKKSVEGSLTFFLTSAIIWLSFYKNLDFKVLLIPLGLTITELVLVFGLDNLILPSVAAYLFSILN